MHEKPNGDYCKNFKSEKDWTSADQPSSPLKTLSKVTSYLLTFSDIRVQTSGAFDTLLIFFKGAKI